MSDLQQFRLVGEDLLQTRLNNSHSGNMSVRFGRAMTITRSGSMLHRLGFNDLVDTYVEGSGPESEGASRESNVHRAIYLATGAGAIVHAHPPHVVALSLLVDTIYPVDAEGGYFFSSGVRILSVPQAVASDEVASGIPMLLVKTPIAVVKGHGSFAIGRDLVEALHWTSCLENVAQVILLHRQYKNLPNLTQG